MAWDEGRWVRFGVGIMVLEFLVLHSSAFISGMMTTATSTKSKKKLIVGLSAFYLLMAVGIALSTDSPSLLWILASIMAARFFQASTASPTDHKTGQKRSAYGIFLYLLLTAGTVFVAVPEMGITTEVLNAVYPSRGGGIWEQHPERPLVAGSLYFALMALGEMTFLKPRSQSELDLKLSQSVE